MSAGYFLKGQVHGIFIELEEVKRDFTEIVFDKLVQCQMLQDASFKVSPYEIMAYNKVHETCKYNLLRVLDRNHPSGSSLQIWKNTFPNYFPIDLESKINFKWECFKYRIFGNKFSNSPLKETCESLQEILDKRLSRLITILFNEESIMNAFSSEDQRLKFQSRISELSEIGLNILVQILRITEGLNQRLNG